jgi:hypothetical protein
VDRFFRKIGLSKGRLDIELTDSSFPLGDCIEGKLSYQLKKPVEGKELWVEVRATQRVTAPKEVTKVRLRGKNERVVEDKTSTLVLYEHRDVLDGHHLYDVGSHLFRLPLPTVIASPYPDSATPNDKWLRRTQRDKLVRYTRVHWQVRAKLEIPWSLGLSDKKKIYITQKPVPEDSAPLTAPPRKAGKNFCAGCGQQRESTDNFCSQCGRRFE